MPAYAVLYQALNPDSRRHVYAAQFNAESAYIATEMCLYLHGKKPGFHLLTLTEMKQ